MRLLVLAIFAICVAFPTYADDFKPQLERFVTDYARPETAKFAQTSSRLPDAVDTICGDLNKETKSAFRASFADTVRELSRIHFLRFGPLLENDRLSRLSFLPDPRGITQRQIRKIYASRDESVLSMASLRGKSVALQGLTALQLIAFDKHGAIVLGEAGDNREFTCSYALAIAQNVADISKNLAADWADPNGFSSVLLSAGPQNASYQSSKEALETVFNGLVTGVIIAKDQDLLPALGSSEEKARPRRFPYSRSINAIPYLSGEIVGIRDAFFSLELKSLTPEEHVWLLDTLNFEFGNAQTYLEKLDPPLRKTFGQGGSYGRVKALTITLDSIRELLSQEVAGALGLSGGFNALDGD
jgi:uncharacterized protein